MVNKYEAKLPDGRIGRRTSKSRVYTHCVAVRSSYEDALFRAKQIPPNLESNFRHYMAYLDGTSRFLERKSWQTEEQHAKQVARDKVHAETALMGCRDIQSWQRALIDEAVARVEENKANGAYDKWFVEGWCGRHDLAVSKASGLRNKTHHAEVAILDAVKIN